MRLIASALSILSLTACVDELDVFDYGNESTGEVSTEISTVPSGVQCIRISAGLREHWFDVAIGVSTATISLGQLDAGPQTVSGAAYDVPCPTDNDPIGDDPTWLADPVAIEVRGGAVSNVHLYFRELHDTDATVDFQPTVVQIAAGGRATYALLADGTVMRWGNHVSNRPEVVPALRGATMISAGGDIYGTSYDACAVLANNDVMCVADRWSDLYYHYGAPHFDAPVSQLVVGPNQRCALTELGSLYCWGGNRYGEISSSQGEYVMEPLQVGWNVASVDVTFGATCVVARDGTSRCWGAQTFTAPISASVEIDTAGSTVFVRKADDSVWSFSLAGSTLTEIPNARGASQLDAGSARCALVEGSVLCWGPGILGDGSGQSSETGVYAKGLNDVVEISTGGAHTCALRDNSEVWCWGYNAHGQVGDGTQLDRFVPTRVVF